MGDDQDAAADDSTAADEAAAAPSGGSGDEAAAAPSGGSGDEAGETNMVGHLQEGEPDSFTGSGDSEGSVTFSDALQNQESDYFQKDDSGGSTETRRSGPNRPTTGSSNPGSRPAGQVLSSMPSPAVVLTDARPSGYST